MTIRDQKTYQIIDAEMVGRKEEPFIFGKHSGKRSLHYFFLQNQIELSSHHCETLLMKIKEHSHNTKRSVSDGELLRMYNSVILDLNIATKPKPIILMHKSLSQIGLVRNFLVRIYTHLVYVFVLFFKQR